MLLSAEMLCLVQSFQQSKLLHLKPKQAKDKSSKSRKLPFITRKKTPSVSCSSEKHPDENLLHPDGNSNLNLLRKSKPGLKQLSGSAPSVTYAPFPSPSLTPSNCLSRQKKFLRHFDVHPDERVIDYFSCALVADILLQGHLYISKNYFAFYSNVFGYVTKLLIPVSLVTTVTKEKTAYILPNAVAVVTPDDRHVFSSLLSRDTTYRLMVQVWKEALVYRADKKFPDDNINALRCRSRVSRRISDEAEESIGYKSSSSSEQTLTTKVTPEGSTISLAKQPVQNKEKGVEVSKLPQSTVLLAVSTVLLVLLFTSAAVLMYKLSLLHHNLTASSSATSHRSLLEVQEYLDINLQKLHKVRQSLEVLTLLIENKKEDVEVPRNAQGDSVVSQGSSLDKEKDNIQQTVDQSS